LSRSVPVPVDAESKARPGARRRLAGRLACGLLVLGLLAAAPLRAQEQTPAGLWQTVSDVDGKPEALVRIREVQGEFLGVIEQILEPDKRDSRCEKCDGERYNQPVQGMTIMTGVRRKDGGFGGGRILDPDNGNLYSCKLTLVDGGRHLEVRGYLGFSLFGRSQTWNRQE
jgi:uncharacterized protein (DUF2147 family)